MTDVTLLLFLAFAAMAVVSAWAIVLSGNIVRMAVYLLLTLGGVAGLYLMLNAQFPAAIQLIVYAGGTLVLIVFGVMLTGRSPSMQLNAGRSERFAALLLAVVLGVLLLIAISLSPAVVSQPMSGEVGTPDGNAGPSIVQIGRALLTDYLVPFEVAAVLLLVVMVGAAYIARRTVAEPEARQQGERESQGPPTGNTTLGDPPAE